MKNSKTRTLCEAAMLIALAQILSYIKLYEFPNGGSVDCAMVPIILFAVRHGCGCTGLPHGRHTEAVRSGSVYRIGQHPWYHLRPGRRSGTGALHRQKRTVCGKRGGLRKLGYGRL